MGKFRKSWQGCHISVVQNLKAVKEEGITRVVCSESKSKPAPVGYTKSVAQGRIHQIESGRARVWIIVAISSAYNVEAVSMKMERMRLKLNNICILEYYLHHKSNQLSPHGRI